MGKTQLVLELLFRTREKHKKCSIMWIAATTTENLHQGYLNVARELNISGWDDPQANLKKLVQTYLDSENAGQWLLVFDNADDLDMWITVPKPSDDEQPPASALAGSQPQALVEYLPRSKQGCIVFTTRDRKTAVRLAHKNFVEILGMDQDTAIELLKKYVANHDLIKTSDDAKALLSELTYLPLAIVQAAAYINENGTSSAEYLSLLREKEEDVIDLLSKDFDDDGRYQNAKNPVATTWLISFEQIRRRDPLAADYLSFMACVEPKDVPQSLLPPGSFENKGNGGHWYALSICFCHQTSIKFRFYAGSPSTRAHGDTQLASERGNAHDLDRDRNQRIGSCIPRCCKRAERCLEIVFSSRTLRATIAFGESGWGRETTSVAEVWDVSFH